MWHRCKNNCAFLPSRLARALWIEVIRITSERSDSINWSRLARALWIEVINHIGSTRTAEGSRLARASPKIKTVEARESLVDRSPFRHFDKPVKFRRGSREPCGSKLESQPVFCSNNPVEARESLVDRSPRLLHFPWLASCRGSREPCGSKYSSAGGVTMYEVVEARESLVDRS